MQRFPGNYNINLTPKEKEEEYPKLKRMMDSCINSYFSDKADFAPTLELNNRLSSSRGRYHPFDNKIDVSGKEVKASRVLDSYDHIEKVIKHELAHWYLHKKKRNYLDGSPEFEKLLQWIGSFSSGSTNKKLQFAPKMPDFGFYNLSICEECGREFLTGQKIGKRSTHRDCGGHFKYLGYALIEMEEE